jgi:hypothetical protein
MLQVAEAAPTIGQSSSLAQATVQRYWLPTVAHSESTPGEKPQRLLSGVLAEDAQEIWLY